MEDQLISFETAKLAKEKGFNMLMWNGAKETLKHRPTQSLLQKWLREEHKIHCLADCNAVGWAWFIEKTNGTSIKDGDYQGPNPESGRWDIYEEALEKGLFEALQLVKQ